MMSKYITIQINNTYNFTPSVLVCTILTVLLLNADLNLINYISVINIITENN